VTSVKNKHIFPAKVLRDLKITGISISPNIRLQRMTDVINAKEKFRVADVPIADKIYVRNAFMGT
jgi:hypothetical protein